jgi:carbonic anhydrase
VASRNGHPRHHSDRASAFGQLPTPFAAVVCCSDCSPEPAVVLDQPPAALITIQNAGPVATDGLVASVEAAVGIDGVPLVVILVYEDCPLMRRAAVRFSSRLPPEMEREFHDPADADARLALAYARHLTQAILARSRVVSEAVARGRVEIEVALVSSETRVVRFRPLR